MTIFAHRCPVDSREQDWIQDSMLWFVAQFGAAAMTRPVILPTSEFFPPPYAGSDDDVRAAVRRVAGYMGLDAGQVTVAFCDDLDEARELRQELPMLRASYQGAAGIYTRHAGRNVITIDRSSAEEPAVLLAVIAHELGHVRLIGENRASADRKDSEALTDLLTVYLGMGVFTANAAFNFRQNPGYSRYGGGWQTSRLGYLTEQMFGYGLACYARLRNEADPPWARHLDTNPRVYMKNGLSYLNHTAAQGPFPPAAG